MAWVGMPAPIKEILTPLKTRMILHTYIPVLPKWKPMASHGMHAYAQGDGSGGSGGSSYLPWYIPTDRLSTVAFQIQYYLGR